MPTRTVTRSSYKRDNTEINKKNYIHEQSSIDEIVNGRKTKGILQRSLHEPEQTPTQIGLNHYGISDSNVNKIISDPNFRTRFAQGNIFQQIAGIDAAQAQRVKPGWRMRSAKKTDNNNGSYNHSKRLITMKYLEPGKEPPFTKTKYFETLNHEMRHAWQRQLVEDLEAGKLTNPEEIKMAKTFQHNFKNQVNSSVDYDGYFNQPVEVDARRAGLEAALNYSKATRFLGQTFDKALDRTLGA